MKVSKYQESTANNPPFLVGFMLARNILVKIKNSKLRKSQNENIFVPQCQNNQGDKIDERNSEFSKIGQYDEVNQKLQFGGLQLNDLELDQKQNLQINPLHKRRQQNQNFSEQSSTYNQNQSKLVTHDIPQLNNKLSLNRKVSLLNKKNVLAQKLNDIGHKLHQTNYELQTYQIIFKSLCQFYQDHSKMQKQVPKIKKQIQSIKQEFHKYQQKTNNNQNSLDQIKFQSKQFRKYFDKQIVQYLRSVLSSNCQLNNRISQLKSDFSKYQKDSTKPKVLFHKQLQSADHILNNNSKQKVESHSLQIQEKQIILKFEHKNIISQINQRKKVKKPLKNNAQLLEDQTQIKRFYQSQMYTL